jgi:hypothetical protein
MSNNFTSIKNIILIVFSLYAKLGFCQINSVFINPSINIYSRFLEQANLSNSEYEFLKAKEILTPGFKFGLGIQSKFSRNSSVDFTINYEKIRFGTDIFKHPVGIHNNTPQSLYKKHAAVINYISLNVNLNKNIKTLSPKLLFFGVIGAKICYEKSHYLRIYGFVTPSSKDGGTTYLCSTYQKYPKINGAIYTGFGFSHKIGKHYFISFSPVFELFFKKFKTAETPVWDYLYFRKPTIGHVYDFSLDIKLHRNF